GDDRQVAHAGHGHVQGPRDRRGGQVENVHLAAQGLEPLLLAHPEAVLLVDDHQPQIAEAHIALQQLVGADHDVHLALRQRFSRAFGVTPERCSSSMITSPRSLKRTSLCSGLWVPLMLSASPSASASVAALVSLADLKPDSTSTSTGQSAKRSLKLL